MSENAKKSKTIRRSKIPMTITDTPVHAFNRVVVFTSVIKPNI